MSVTDRYTTLPPSLTVIDAFGFSHRSHSSLCSDGCRERSCLSLGQRPKGNDSGNDVGKRARLTPEGASRERNAPYKERRGFRFTLRAIFARRTPSLDEVAIARTWPLRADYLRAVGFEAFDAPRFRCLLRACFLTAFAVACGPITRVRVFAALRRACRRTSINRAARQIASGLAGKHKLKSPHPARDEANQNTRANFFEPRTCGYIVKRASEIFGSASVSAYIVK